MASIDALSSYLQNFTYQTPDQRFRIEALNLRPMTQHWMVMDGLDWSPRCVQDGKNLGDPLISTANGQLWLSWYWSNQNQGALGLNSSLANIFNSAPLGNKTWCLTNLDGTSQCRRTLFAGSQNPSAFTSILNQTSNALSSPSLPGGGLPPVCQTFYFGEASVANSTQAYVVSINLFCKSNPTQYNNLSGLVAPGVTIYIVPTLGGIPNFSTITDYPSARREYYEILPSLDASYATTFAFDRPVLMNTNETYGIVVIADGNAPYYWWEDVIGQIDLNTGRIVTTITGFQGQLFDLGSTGTSWLPIAGAALKFNVTAGRYSVAGVPANTASQTFSLHIGRYEFAEYDIVGTTGTPWGGELVYAPNPTSDGNCIVVAGQTAVTSLGSAWSTWFVSNTEPNFLIVTDGAHVNVRRVAIPTINGTAAFVDSPWTISGSSLKFYATAPVAAVYQSEASRDLRGLKNRLLLAGSTANSLIYFSNGMNLIGTISGCVLANAIFENIIVSEMDPQIYVDAPSAVSYTVQDDFAYSTTTNAVTSYSLSQNFNVGMFAENIFSPGPAKVLLSRSNEVQLTSPSYAKDPANSSIIVITTSSDHDYQAASISGRQNHVYYTRYFINDDHTNEHTTHGNATSKAVSSKVSLANGQFAEDLLVYTQIYRPPGTDILVYGKLWNSADSDSFTDKDWTAMTCTVNPNVYSSATDMTDEIEQTWDMKLYPTSLLTYNAAVTTLSNQTNVTASAAVFTGANVAVGDLVKIYQPLFPNTDYQICSIVNVVSTTVITVDTPISNAGVIGAGLAIDLIKNPQQAFRNILNQNVVRYYATSTGAYFDTFNAFAVKVVFQSNNMAVIPYVSSLRAIAVSA